MHSGAMRPGRIIPVRVVLHACLTGGLVALLYGLAYLQPVWFVHFLSEDSVGEHASAAAWLVASLAVAAAVVRTRSDGRAGLIALSLLAFFVGMEELSWGQRLLGVDAPGVFRTHNTQGEINFHNFVVSHTYYPMLAEGILVATVLLPIAARLSKRVGGLCDRLGVPLVPAHLWLLFLVPVYFLDYDVIAIPETRELMELTLALAVAAWTGEILLRSRWSQARGAWGHLAPTLVVGAAVAALLIPLMAFASRPASAGRFARVAAVEYPKRGLNDQALLLFRHIEANPRLRSSDVHLEHALLLLRLGRDDEARELLSRRSGAETKLPDPVPNEGPRWLLEGHRLDLLGESEAARRAYTKAVALDLELLRDESSPTQPFRIHLSLGSSYLALGREQEAESHFAAALSSAPGWTALKSVPRHVEKRRELWERIASELPARRP